MFNVFVAERNFAIGLKNFHFPDIYWYEYYHYKLRNVPEERRSHLLHGGSLKSRMTHSKFDHLHPVYTKTATKKYRIIQQ